ncbi:MAG: 2-hydroxyacid dehydrogenase [Malacoplasma sp.]|nr:2-hydroxyacid dehydrogenase [Malacoplasma sp.]MDE6429058.1 2-hydroxyacid dehydrogenase [Malacoplasma sp.]MDE6562762.1 2-hydroxyacid dehydrogenase [Malacoplasma sp.]MDE7112556.1 2-hydroxyacid dehydrogenase [Malacoplasma sp.]
METIAVFSTQEYDKYFLDKNKVNARYQCQINYFKVKLTSESADLAKGAKIVCVFVNDQVNKEVIDKLYNGGTRLIALRCAGFNNVDLVAAKNKGIKVVRVPAYSPHAIAEFALGMMIALNRKITIANNRTKESNFSINGLLGFDMHQKTVGIIGTGKIAKVLIKLLSGFDLRVLAYDVVKDEEFAKKYNVIYTDLETIWSKSDIISLHCPLNDGTKYIINKDSISKMKNGVLLVNTGRGPLVNSLDLIEGIKSGKIGAAALDVYENESEYFYYDHSNKVLKDDVLSRLLSFKNVIVSSHQAYFTYEALTSIATTTLQNIDSFLSGEQLTNEVL